MYEHKHKKNRQDRDQYLYMDRHDAIISVKQFESVQILMENRKHHVRGGLPMMYVIDEGIFKGFIPINHHWVNDDPGTYYDISNSVRQPGREKKISKSRFSAFDLEGYQVVRGQFMQVRYEGPAITISGERIAFNKFCVQKFGNIAYVQLLLHPTERKIAIRPCSETDTHSIRWRPDPDKPVYSKALNCQHFGNALYSIMAWNPEFNYRIRGTYASHGEESIIVFNLPNAVPLMLTADSSAGEDVQKRRISLCPEEWAGDFGEEFYVHGMENGFFYIAPKTEWNSQAKGILAPGIQQYASPPPDEVQMRIEEIMEGKTINNGY